MSNVSGGLLIHRILKSRGGYAIIVSKVSVKIKTDQENKGMIKKVCGFISGLMILCLAAIAVLLFLPRVLGYDNMAVLSGSMEPGIPVGSVVYAKTGIDPNTLSVGDVITYQLSGDTRVTHRIRSIEASEQKIITKGDANDAEDAAPVAFTQVVGRVDFHLPLLGYLTIYIKTPLGIAGIAAVFVILILTIFLPDVLASEEKERKKDIS